jgi:hypothetical protein
MTGQKKRESTPLTRKVESFALELLHLIRGARIYPNKHPTLLEVAKGVIRSAPFDSTGSLTIGVTSRELVVGGQFVAGKASSLASMLNGKKILQIFWKKEATLEDIWRFARVVSTPKLEGVPLQETLRSEVNYIDVEPLQFDQIHSRITGTAKDADETAEQRTRQAWLALMSHEAPVEQLASALASDEFWETAKSEWTKSGLGDSEGFVQFLLTLGERLEDALTFLPDEQREVILDYLTQMGRCLAVKDLLRIVGRETQESKRLRLGKASLLKEIDGERFIDLLAGLAAMGDHGTQRFVEVYRRFSPIAKTDELLSLVRSRLAPGKDGGFTADVWKTVENLILNLSENPFMDREYSESLESLLNPSNELQNEEDDPILQENPEEYLDQLTVALALEKDEDPMKRILDRIEARANQLGPLRVFGFIRLVDEAIPKLLPSLPYFVQDLFLKGLRAISSASIQERQALIGFAVTHERHLLDTALKALTEEKRISTRHFLVNLLSRFSAAATPTFVVKSRISPWYVARNLAIVLGQQGFPQVLRPLQALSNHPHPKVSREAARSLRKVQTSLSQSQEEPENITLTLDILQDSTGKEKSCGARCA